MMTADRLISETKFPQETVIKALNKLKTDPLVRTRDRPARFLTYRCPFCPAISKGRKNAQKHFFKCAGKAVGVALTGR